jgi:hypothetical protein
MHVPPSQHDDVRRGGLTSAHTAIDFASRFTLRHSRITWKIDARIVDDLDFGGAVVGPQEADAPLVVDANAVLT